MQSNSKNTVTAPSVVRKSVRRAARTLGIGVIGTLGGAVLLSTVVLAWVAVLALLGETPAPIEPDPAPAYRITYSVPAAGPVGCGLAGFVETTSCAGYER